MTAFESKRFTILPGVNQNYTDHYDDIKWPERCPACKCKKEEMKDCTDQFHTKEEECVSNQTTTEQPTASSAKTP